MLLMLRRSVSMVFLAALITRCKAFLSRAVCKPCQLVMFSVRMLVVMCDDQDPYVDLQHLIQHRPTSPITAIVATSATGCRRQTRNVNMGHNKLLSQLTYCIWLFSDGDGLWRELGESCIQIVRYNCPSLSLECF